MLPACKNNPPSGTSAEMHSSKQFYPISNYVYGELNYLDSMPLAVIKYTTIDGVTDTSVVEKSKFKGIAQSFFTPDIGSSKFKNQYKEESFIDATLGTITLTYTATNDTAEIRKTDVLLNQEDTKVRTLYVEKKITGTDNSGTQKMLWTTHRYCQITTLQQKTDTPEKIIVEKYVWDDLY